MGTDIHQLNIIKQRDRIVLEGDARIFAKGPSMPMVEDYKTIEEILPGRFYDMFAIVAGVRGSMFQERCFSHEGVPKELEKFDLNLEDLHSFIWYYAGDLAEAMRQAATKISLYARTYLIEDDKYEAGGYEDISSECSKIAAKIERGLKKHGYSANGDQVVVLLYFDS